MKDFFISYNHRDQKMAEWIAWQLEDAGYTVVIQAWDFQAGESFINNMHKASQQCQRTVAVLSANYFASKFTNAEWEAAFKNDPKGEKGLLVPVRIQAFDIPGLLSRLAYINLVGLEEDAARKALLKGIQRKRKKPETPPPFPRVVKRKPAYQLSPTRHIPFWVPEPPAHFVGRTEKLAELRHRLLEHPGVVALVGKPTVSIYGMAGIGKSYLALQFAHEPHLQDMFEGIYWQSCGQKSLDIIVAELAEKLGIDIREFPPEKALSSVKEGLSQQRCLLILDDVQSDDTGKLIPGGRASLVMTTRRRDLAFLTHPVTVEMEEFSEAECMALFKDVLAQRLQGHQAEAKKIFAALGRLPIAISVAAGMLKEGVRWSFAALLELFEHPQGAPLDKLAHRQHNVKHLLDRALDDLDDHSENLLCSMAACAAEGCRFAFACQVAGMEDREQAFSALQHLVDVSLVREVDREQQWYALHALVRQAGRARQRFAGLPEKQVQVTLELFESWETRWQVCEQELPQAWEALAYAASKKDIDIVSQLAYNGYALTRRTGRLPEAWRFMEAWRVLAEELGNQEGLQASYGNQALILQSWGRLEEAMKLLKEQEKICRQLGNQEGLWRSYYNQASILQKQGNLKAAMMLFEKVVNLTKELGNQEGIAWARYGMAGINSEKGNISQARQLAQEALNIFSRLNMPAEIKMVEDFLKGLAKAAKKKKRWKFF